MSKDTGLFKGTQIIWYIAYVIEALLLFRFLLKLLAANAGAGFTQLIYGVTGVFLAPFRYVFGTEVVGQSVFEWSTLLAMLAYYILALGIVRLVAMGRTIHEPEADAGLRSEEIN